jgi:UDP-N-acetylglucosamine transferase subunit ALG13
LALFGSQKNPFQRLARALSDLNLPEKIIVQSGHTKITSPNLDIRPFVGPDEYSQLNQQAKIIITHAGVGSIMQALSFGKPVIVVPRLKKFGEHLNDHQTQIADQFAKAGYIIKLGDMDSLGQAIQKAKTFKPPKLKFDNHLIKKIITDFINEN